MAIQPGGDGSQANPYVIDNSDGLAWSNFNTLNNNSDNKGKYLTFADVHVDENGDFDISGTGISTDPFIVSTYREMLHCTGASNIHQCKMIAKDSTTREMTYRYDSENPETHEIESTYCRYNPAPTTIDWNSISEGSRSTIYVSMHCDFNGWTLLNFRISAGDSGSWGGFFTCGWVANDKADVYNGFFLNTQITCSSDGYTSLFNANIHDNIMHIDVTSTIAPSSVGFCYASSYGHGFSRNSLTLKIYGNRGFSGYNIGDNYEIVDSVIYLDAEFQAYGIPNSDGSNGSISLIRSTLKGKYKFVTAGAKSFIRSCTDSIYDVESISEATAVVPQVGGTRCIFNSDKVSWSQTGWTGVSSEHLLSPSWLQEHTNFPIGVDT
jgi:hypothetical protein